MTSVRDGGMDWPGFSYSEDEWRRMDVLAGAVPDGMFVKYVLVNAVVFIVIAAIGIAGVFLPLATVLFPVPAETSALKFAMLLAGCCFLIIGLGLPLSLGLSARLVSSRSMREQLAAAPGDEALAAKVSWQINRIMLVMCGLLVPGMLVFIIYDIDAGPVVAVLKWAAIALMGFSILAGVRRRGR